MFACIAIPDGRFTLRMVTLMTIDGNFYEGGYADKSGGRFFFFFSPSIPSFLQYISFTDPRGSVYRCCFAASTRIKSFVSQQK